MKSIFRVFIHMDKAMRNKHDVARALREISRALQDGKEEGSVKDMDQNVVGTFSTKVEE